MQFKDRPKGPSIFLKVEPGKSIKGILKGDPLDFQTHWKSGASTVCKGEQCTLCKENVKKGFRFRINFLVNEEGTYVAKIFEQGGVVYDQLKSLTADYVLEKTLVKITREGEGLHTKYAILPLPHTFTEESLKMLSGVSLQDLTKFGREDEEALPSSDDDNIPF